MLIFSTFKNTQKTKMLIMSYFYALEQIKNLLNRNAIVIASLEGYTEDLRKTSPQTAHYLDLRLEELYEIYKPKTVVR
jgi:hypothetical protein